MVTLMPTRPDAPASESRAIDWLDWGPEAFARAARERKPVLLSIGASVVPRVRGHGPHHLRRSGHRGTGRRATVPVRVDADRRPDVNERYNLEGWPTTALLTPSARS